VEHAPPPFFRTGPSPLARLFIFTILSLVLLGTDARLKYLETVRQVVSVVIYPLQRIASAPFSIMGRVTDFFTTQSSLKTENARLSQQNLTHSAQLQQFALLQAENEHLRKLLGARERLKSHSAFAEVLYAARDPFSRRVWIDKGSQDEVQAGQPVIDGNGVIGQVTRVMPWLSEVTLITDKGHLVPVLNTRNGIRAVLGGTGSDGSLELKFVPLNADFENGDQLVTSGIDGVYPPGLPVAQVVNVERNAAFLFARISCRPLGGVSSHRQVLVVRAEQKLPERPSDEEPKKTVPAKKGRRTGAGA
jgi:rod shape-determining protein MreC